jgi:2,4-dienoyl-CoA reductase-like NADH-dependent reductase (Old Yellow Enzyme family)
LQSGQVDVILIGRASLRDPYWPLRAAHELGAEVAWPPQYERGMWPKAR